MKKFSLFLVSLVFAVCSVISSPICIVRGDDVDDALILHFIDVGQGDSCIIELPDGRTMLVDAGNNYNSVKSKLSKYIDDNIKDDDGKVYFDYVIMTHSDADHIGSMEYILKNYDVGTVYRPNQPCTYQECDDRAKHLDGSFGFWGENFDDLESKAKKTYHDALNAAYENAKEVIVTNPYDSYQNSITSTNDKKYTINFYSPLSPSYDDYNNYSPIMVIEYMGRNIVLTGDAEKQNEAEFVKAATAGVGRYEIFKNFSADVIKLGHHGSHTSTSPEYLNVVTKASLRSGVFVIISCGEGNSYNHPRIEVLNRLSEFGFSDENILRTDKLGDIVIDIKQVDGEYKAVYNERVGGSDNDDGLLSILLSEFNKLNTFEKIAIIVVLIIVVIAIAFIVFKSQGKKRRKRK